MHVLLLCRCHRISLRTVCHSTITLGHSTNQITLLFHTLLFGIFRPEAGLHFKKTLQVIRGMLKHSHSRRAILKSTGGGGYR